MAERKPDSAAGHDDLSLRATLPRSTGLALAINAVPDAYLLLDAPHCAYRRLAYLQGNHDVESTLTLFPDMPRVTNTELSPLKVIKNRDTELEEHLTALAQFPNAGVVLVDAVAMVLITASDYGRLCSIVAHKTGKTVLPIPHRSLTCDYLGAYADILEALAIGIPLTPSKNSEQRRVALIGYLWDRNEGDHRANRKELQRICAALDLELSSLWLSGSPSSDLARVAQADWIVSLPYGRRAAQILASRLDRKIVHCELPFGLPATLRFVLTLGAATGRLPAAIAFLEQELSEVLPPLKWIVPFALLHRRLGYVGDPHLFRGLQETAWLVGCTIPFAAFTNLPVPARDSVPLPTDWQSLEIPEDLRALLAPGSALPAPAATLAYPHARELSLTLQRLAHERALDVLLTNSFGFLTEGVGIVEFGFPSYHTHCLQDRPFLGTRGFLSIVEQLINASRQFEVRVAHRDVGEPKE